jgi:hypothetical protein
VFGMPRTARSVVGDVVDVSVREFVAPTQGSDESPP